MTIACGSTSYILEPNESSLSPGRMSQYTIEIIPSSLAVTFPLAFQVSMTGEANVPSGGG